MSLEPIQTHYKGYHFRSRTEARWAVFFDALGVEYNYELEGYTLSDGTKYLPDFYLPNYYFIGAGERKGMFAEVKYQANDAEIRKCMLLCKDLKTDVVLLEGPPDYKNYTLFSYLDMPDEDKKEICEEYDQSHELAFVFKIDMNFDIGIAVHGGMDNGEFSSVPDAMDHAIKVSRAKRFEFHGK